MAVRRNSNDGQTPGAVVTAAGSAVGAQDTAYGLVSSTTAGAWTYVDSSAAAGPSYPRAVQVQETVAATTDVVSFTGSTDTSGVAQFGMCIVSVSGQMLVAQTRQSSGAPVQVRINNNTSRQLQLLDRAGTLWWTTAAGLALNTWYMIDTACAPATSTTGFLAIRYRPFGGAVIESFSTNAADCGTTTLTDYRVGKLTSGGTATIQYTGLATAPGTTFLDPPVRIRLLAGSARSGSNAVVGGATTATATFTTTAASGTPVVAGGGTTATVTATATAGSGTPAVVGQASTATVTTTSTASAGTPTVVGGATQTVVTSTATAAPGGPAVTGGVTAAAVAFTSTAAPGAPAVTGGPTATTVTMPTVSAPPPSNDIVGGPTTVTVVFVATPGAGTLTVVGGAVTVPLTAGGTAGPGRAAVAGEPTAVTTTFGAVADPGSPAVLGGQALVAVSFTAVAGPGTALTLRDISFAVGVARTARRPVGPVVAVRRRVGDPASAPRRIAPPRAR